MSHQTTTTTATTTSSCGRCGHGYEQHVHPIPGGSCRECVELGQIVCQHFRPAETRATSACPSWCTIDHEGPDDEGLHRADVERTDGFTVTVYRTDPADYQVHVDTNSFRGLTVEEALGLADALVRAAAFVQTGGAS